MSPCWQLTIHVSRNATLFRLLCAIEGKYLVEEYCSALAEDTDTVAEQDDVQSLGFCISIPNLVGRGFVEVTLSLFPV